VVDPRDSMAFAPLCEARGSVLLIHSTATQVGWLIHPKRPSEGKDRLPYQGLE
jgi:hypothetical protein